VTAAILLAASTGCSSQNRDGDNNPPGSEISLAQAPDPALHAQVVAFCGDCHAYPPPDSFPRDAWHDEVEQGFGLYQASGRSDLMAPPVIDVVRYYRQLAPVELDLAAARETFIDDADNYFTRSTVPMTKDGAPPAVSSIISLEGTTGSETAGPGGPALVFCDMGRGEVLTASFDDRQPHVRRIGRAAHPARAVPCDLDQDGIRDYLVADLGSFNPADHDRGQVLWLHGAADASLDQQVLLSGIGRVADATQADFDRDGTAELVVGEFGWRSTGGIHLLKGTPDTSPPTFDRQIIDPRHGTIHVSITDLDDDGRQDIVALVSQEHESVTALLNRGPDGFQAQELFVANDPAFGVSGIELVDLDQDGDTDVLLSSGDTLDTYYVRPDHGVIWLENRGQFPFTPHRLIHLPGAMRATAGDVDGDGDLDVVVGAYVPAHLLRGTGLTDPATVIWLEQTDEGGPVASIKGDAKPASFEVDRNDPRTVAAGHRIPASARFRPHLIERGEGGHMCVEVGDFDGDGQLDIAAGTFHVGENDGRPWLRMYWGKW